MNRRIFLGSLAAAGLAWSGKTPRQSEVAYIQRFLAEHKLPAARQGVVQQHQGWVYELRADRFIIARRLGERPEAGKVESTRGELVWFRAAANGSWQVEAPTQRSRPAAASERYYQSHDLPGEWAAKVLGVPKAPAAVHYFTVLHCEFTPPGSPEATSPVVWDMPGWFANADRIAKEFAAGKL